jgi:hypothetical protein
MVTYIDIAPAEGRDYSMASEAKASWESGQDFEIMGEDEDTAVAGELINKNNKPADTRVIVWYDGGRKSVIIK